MNHSQNSHSQKTARPVPALSLSPAAVAPAASPDLSHAKGRFGTGAEPPPHAPAASPGPRDSGPSHLPFRHQSSRSSYPKLGSRSSGALKQLKSLVAIV